MKKYRIILVISLIVALLCTACGSSSTSSSSSSSSSYSSSSSSSSGIVIDDSIDMASANSLFDFDFSNDSYVESSNSSESSGWVHEADSPESSEIETSVAKEDADTETDQKLIKTVSIDMETKTFDALLEYIQTETSNLGGYISDSDISGYGYDNYGGYTRYARMTLKIPAGSDDSLVECLSEYGSVTSKTETVEDVTLQYVDIESRIETLETEYSRLIELMDEADDIDSIITIEERVSEINYTKESYVSQLRTLNNQIDYTEISLYIDEVEEEKPIEKTTFWGETGEKFISNVKSILSGFRSFFSWFISSIPYFILYGGILLIIIKAILAFDRHERKKRLERQKKNKEKENEKIQTIEDIDK